MFVSVTENVYKWETPDPEHGEMLVGHLVSGEDGYVLIDPPMVPGIVGELSKFGKCLGIIVTSVNHLRGSRDLAAHTGSKYYFPEHQKKMIEPGQDNVVFYGENTELPMGFDAVRCRTAEPVFGKIHLDEMALQTRYGVFVGDLAHGRGDDYVAFAPEDIIPEPGKKAVGTSLFALNDTIGEDVETVFCGHENDILGNYSTLLEERKKELEIYR